MSTPATKQSRWLAWKPKAHISHDSAESAPTKPSKPGSVGFEGSPSAEFAEIEAEESSGNEPRQEDIDAAIAVLDQAGARLMRLEGTSTIGMWSDLDGPEVRAALRILGMEGLPVRYLDGSGTPMRYKVRRVDGDPVPMSVLVEMDRHPAEPWKVRDRMLEEMGWCSKGISRAEWKAAAPNPLFQGRGNTGKPARITAATVRHGEKEGGNG